MKVGAWGFMGLDVGEEYYEDLKDVFHQAIQSI
jgi:hypothetical protein